MSSLAKEGVKQLLRTVDDLVLKNKGLKNPEKLLKKKKELQVGDETVSVGPGTTQTKVGIKQKVKIPEVPKETIEEFLTSFNSIILFQKKYLLILI
jgi:hypothetical protein